MNSSIISILLSSSLFCAIITGISNYVSNKKNISLQYIISEDKEQQNRIKEIVNEIGKIEYNDNNFKDLNRYLFQLELNINPYHRGTKNDLYGDSLIWEELEALKKANDTDSFNQHKELLCYYLSVKIMKNQQKTKSHVCENSLTRTSVIFLFVFNIFVDFFVYYTNRSLIFFDILIKFIYVFFVSFLPYLLCKYLLFYSEQDNDMVDNEIDKKYKTIFIESVFKTLKIILSIIIVFVSPNFVMNVLQKVITPYSNKRFIVSFFTILYFIFSYIFFKRQVVLYYQSIINVSPIVKMSNKFSNKNLKNKEDKIIALYNKIKNEEYDIKICENLRKDLIDLNYKLKCQFKNKINGIGNENDLRECKNIQNRLINNKKIIKAINKYILKYILNKMKNTFIILQNKIIFFNKYDINLFCFIIGYFYYK